MKIQTISDTHNNHESFKIYDSDIIIHAGDFCERGDRGESLDFLQWFANLNIKHKVLVPGNHETWIEKNLGEFEDSCKSMGVHLLIGEKTIDSIKFWGSPFTLDCGYGWAWNVGPTEIAHYWDEIPDDTNVVICHQPCYGILDEVNGVHTGCKSLTKKIQEIKPSLFVCGHIHQSRGKINIDGVTYINTATVTSFHEL